MKVSIWWFRIFRIVAYRGGDAKRLCRRYIGFEIDQKYCYIAVKRLTEKTGVSLFEKF